MPDIATATRTLAPILTAISKRLGTELPKPVVDALADAETLRHASRKGIFRGPDLTSAVADALLAGKDPLASKDVQRAVLAHQITEANIEHRLDNHARERVAGVIREYADAVIDTWRPVVERADEALRNFREVAPAADLFDNNQATSLPSRALTPWGQAREAVALLEQLGKGWQALAAAGAAQIPLGGRPLIVADLGLEELRQIGTNPKITDVARLDVPLELASTKTYAERVARLARERQESADDEANAPERARRERRRMAIRVPAANLT